MIDNLVPTFIIIIKLSYHHPLYFSVMWGLMMMIIKLQKQQQVEQMMGKKVMIRQALQTLPENLQAIGEAE